MTRQTDAQRDMALVADLLRGAPGDRGVEFWVVVARNICAKHGVHSLMGQRDADDIPAPPPPRPQLSNEDCARLRSLADGLTVEQIAAQHCYNINTIKTSLHKAYRILGARNGPHAVALAIRAGLID